MSYFDYYVSRITDFSEDQLDINSLIYSIISHGNLYPGVGMYVPARLGISPSSAMKLFKRKFHLAGILNVPLKKFLYNLNLNCRTAIPTNGLIPPEYIKYLVYDEQMDMDASEILTRHYSSSLSKPEDGELQDHEDAVSTKEQFVKQYVKGGQCRFPKKNSSIDFPVTDNHCIDNVIFTQQYRHSFTFIIRLQNDLHLTLEMDSLGRIYGIPPKLQKSYPQIEDYLVKDILTPLLRNDESTNVNVLPLSTTGSAIKTLSGNREIIHQNNGILTEQEETDSENIPTSIGKKRRHLRILNASDTQDSGQNALHTPEKPPYNPKFIVYSDCVIIESSKKTSHSKLVRIKKGDYRIAFENIGNGNYKLVKIAPRGNFYNEYEH